ncbi:MAG TPA: hypothetical protein VEP71_00665, partial [Gallionella sp.]|nr:hypothetical protein [Gallionella sp.]
ARAHDVRMGRESQSILFINVHAPSRGNYEALVMQLLDAVEEKFGAENKIIAGDFNLTTAYRQSGETIKNTTGELVILERMQGKQGLINAWQFLHPQEPLPQTLRWSNKPLEPYHCDGIFISKTLLPYLQQTEVICHDDWTTLSDHNPIVATFL